jgi:hypothetical protein
LTAKTAIVQELGVIVVGPDGKVLRANGSEVHPGPGETVIRLSVQAPSGILPACSPYQMDELVWHLQTTLSEHLPKQFETAEAEAEFVVTAISQLTDTDLGFMDMESCYWTLQELAARARLALEKLSESNPLTRDLHWGIRKLTSLALRQKIPRFVLGLRHEAKENWGLLALTAQRKLRELGLALTRPNRICKRARRQEASGQTGGPRILRLCLPNLQALLSERRVMLIGGVPRQDKLERLKAMLGAQPIWPDIVGVTSSKRLEGPETSIRQGKVACVLILNGIMSHQVSDKIVAACKSNGTPFRTVNKAGFASVVEALREIEAELS